MRTCCSLAGLLMRPVKCLPGVEVPGASVLPLYCLLTASMAPGALVLQPQPPRPKWEPRVPPGTSFVFREAADKARRLPPPPRPPLRPASLNPPPDRPPRVWPPMVFRVPNLSEPRPRIRSRGVKPEPEDAIKRDPRVITLWGELCQTRGIVADTVGWEEVRAEAGAAAKGGGSNTPASARRPSTGGASAGLPSPRSGGKGGGGGAASALTTPRAAWGVRAASPSTPKVTPSPPRPGTAADPAAATPAEPELSAEEEAAYLPTLAARGAAIAAFEPASLQEVADFVSDVKAQGGDVPRSGHAAVTFPRSRWRAMVEAAAVFDELVEMCDTLTKWECDPQVCLLASLPSCLPACLSACLPRLPACLPALGPGLGFCLPASSYPSLTTHALHTYSLLVFLLSCRQHR